VRYYGILFVGLVFLVACGNRNRELSCEEVKIKLGDIYTRSELVKEFGVPGAIVEHVDKVNRKFIYCNEDYDTSRSGFLGFTVLLSPDESVIQWNPLFLENHKVIEGDAMGTEEGYE
jgi:hypothetical protein